MIATALLPHRIKVTPVAGVDGHGRPVAGDTFEVRARVIHKRRMIAGAADADRVSTVTCQLRPDVTVSTGDLVTLPDDGTRCAVAEVLVVGDLVRPHHIELVLDTSSTEVSP